MRHAGHFLTRGTSKDSRARARRRTIRPIRGVGHARPRSFFHVPADPDPYGGRRRSSTRMKFRFPVVIIDEDFRSENASGLGIRALARALEAEGFEVLGVTSYGDLTAFAQQQSRASAFILSIDDEEFGSGSPEDTQKALA